MINLLSLLPSLFNSVQEVVDNVHTSDEEKYQAKQKMLDAQSQIFAQVLEYEAQLTSARSEIIKIEAQSQSWITRNWRPITMLSFLCLAVLDSLGWLPTPLAPEAWELLKYGLTGYVVGRSAEKTLPKVAEIIKK